MIFKYSKDGCWVYYYFSILKHHKKKLFSLFLMSSISKGTLDNKLVSYFYNQAYCVTLEKLMGYQKHRFGKNQKKSQITHSSEKKFHAKFQPFRVHY